MVAISFTILKNIDFRRLMGARVLGIFGLQAQAVAVGWQVYTLTNDVLMLGLVGLCEAIPAILCSLVAGHVVDISRPHRIYTASLLLLAMAAGVLWALAAEWFTLSTNTHLVVMFACVFFSGLVRGFIMPASFTLMSQIVPREHIPAASAWLSSGFQLAAILGPATAGLLYGGYGAAVAWALPFSFLILAFMVAASISHPHRHYRNTQTREPALQSIVAGWKFILGNRVLLSVMLLDMFAVLFGGAVAILPAFADTVLQLGSEGLGLLRAAPAVGSIASALFLALRPMKVIRARVLLWAVAGFGVSMLGFGLSTTFLSAGMFLILSGACDSVSMVVRGTLMQLLIPDAMRGRVSAVNSMFIISSNEIGAFESGAAARLMGLVPSILFGGCMTLGVVATAALTAPNLRRLKVETQNT